MTKFDVTVYSSHLIDDIGLVDTTTLGMYKYGPFLLRKEVGQLAEYVEDPRLWVYVNGSLIWKSIDLLIPHISKGDNIEIFKSANPEYTLDQLKIFDEETFHVVFNSQKECELTRLEIYRHTLLGRFLGGFSQPIENMFDWISNQEATIHLLRLPSGGGWPSVDVRLLDRAPIILQTCFDNLETWLKEHELNIWNDFEIIVSGKPLDYGPCLIEDGNWNTLLYSLNISIVIQQLKKRSF